MVDRGCGGAANGCIVHCSVLRTPLTTVIARSVAAQQSRSMSLPKIGSPGIREARNDSPADNERWRIGGVFLLSYLVVELALSWGQPFPSKFDELEHLSYVTSLARFGPATTQFFPGLLLGKAWGSGFGAAQSYINHPPLYYLLLRLLISSRSQPDFYDVLCLRLVNVAISTLAIACVISIGILRGLDQRKLLLYCLFSVFSPPIILIGSIISNDNLALLGGCLCLLGAQIVSIPPERRIGFILLGAGCAIATCAKLTAGLLTASFAAIFLVLECWLRGTRPSAKLLGCLLLVEVAAALPYVWYIVIFGSPAPITQAFVDHYREIAQLWAQFDGWNPDGKLGVLSYALRFLYWWLTNWNPVPVMDGLISLPVLVGPLFMVLFALAGWCANVLRLQQSDHLLVAGGLAMAIVVPINFVFSYKLYTLTGAPPTDATPRYYFPIALVLIPAAACWTIQQLKPSVITGVTWFLLLSLMVGPAWIAIWSVN